MTARSPNLSRAVAIAVKSATIDAKDAGAVALIKRYAALIDEAAPAAKYRKPLERLTRAVALYEGDDAEQVVDALKIVEAALAEHSVASDLGPKLLAALSALGLTLAGRGTGARGGTTSGGATPRAKDELKARRDSRVHRAAAMDTPAP